MSSSNELLVKGFDALQYVTNPYALFGFVFFVGMVVIGIFVRHNKVKATLLVTFAALALGATYRFLDTTFANIEKKLLVHLVRESGRSFVAPGIEIELLDIETLKGKKNWNFNLELDDGDHVFDEVFVRAGVIRDGSTARAEINATSWREFMQNMEDSEDVQEQLRAEKIKDIPFAKFRVFVDGVEDTTYAGMYYFKNEILCIPSDSSDCSRAKLKIVNIYNTKHHSSGEREAVNIRVYRE